MERKMPSHFDHISCHFGKNGNFNKCQFCNVHDHTDHHRMNNLDNFLLIVIVSYTVVILVYSSGIKTSFYFGSCLYLTFCLYYRF